MFGVFISFVIISEEARFTEKKNFKMYFDSLRNLNKKLLSLQEEFSAIMP